MKIIKATLLISFFFVFFYCCVESTTPEITADATYTGSEKCQSCHAKEYNAYSSSDHFHAMDTALPRSVKANFNNSFFVYFGDTSYFYQRDGKYLVKTKDSAGKKTEFTVSFTFGWQPLQQYLVAFPDGRIQTLPFCWDTRPKEQGGQRWFHIYNKEKILPGDELYWTDVNQNWNNMCADCHTTGFFKNFDISSNTFHSAWNESKVSCESCHGPASLHLKWAEKKSPEDSLMGFAMNLKGETIHWKFNEAKGVAYPDKVVQNNTLVETCARCHARASHISDYYHHGQSFLQTHIPATISTASYHIDGQIRDEDYEYASFLQSKMYANGVTCVNCHDPHTMQLKTPGNTVCYSCHTPEKFDTPDHTHHLATSTGSKCVSCHMPVTTYMVVDDRYDHSIRIPRPDLSETMNTPNACNKCHQDKTVSWAATSFKQWYGDKIPKEKTYGQLLYATSKFSSESESALYQLLSSKNYPAIAKATAMEQYNQFFTTRIMEQVRAYLQSPDPNLRLNALHSTDNLPENALLNAAAPLLNDPVLSVRTEALNTLVPVYTQLDENTKQRFNAVLNEYLTIQRNQGDRPESYLNQGIILAGTGRLAEAEQAYLLGLKRFPKFVPLYGNIADLYRSQNDEAKSQEFLQRGIAIQPENALLHYAYGLWQVRNKHDAEGMAELRKAIELNTADPTYTYGYAVAMYSKHKEAEAIGILEKFIAKNGNNPMIVQGLISFYQDQKQTAKADYYTNLRKTMFGY